jgi:hypothetical protein
MMDKVRLVSTTNERFKYMEGEVIPRKDFSLGFIVWFGDLHTSTVSNIEFIYTQSTVVVEVTTKNSVYVFSVED